MAENNRRRFIFIVAFIFLVVLICTLIPLLQSWIENQNAVPITWNSVKVREIEKEYQLLWDTYDNHPEKVEGDYGKEKFGITVMLVNKLFRKRFSERELRQLALSSDIPSISEDDQNRFVYDLLGFVVKTFVDLEDRETLVNFLSMRCPEWVEWPEHIEFYLAFHGKSIDDPILILCEAYSKSQVPETRKTLAAAIRRAFNGYEIDGKDDAEYIKNATQWYRKEKSHLVANDDYTRNETSGGPKRLLFIDTQPSVKKPSDNQQKSSQDSSEKWNIDGGTVAQPLANNESVEEDLAKLAGTWKVVEVTHEEQSVPEKKTKGVQFVFKKDSMTMVLVGPDGKKMEQHARIRLGRQGNLRTIDMITNVRKSKADDAQIDSLINELKEETDMGIYELRGDLLRICSGKPGTWRRPTSFETKNGSNTSAITLKRVKQ